MCLKLVGDHTEVRPRKLQRPLPAIGFGLLRTRNPPVPADFDPASMLRPDRPDTDVLACTFVDEAGADAATRSQRRVALERIESAQPLVLPKPVALELEWVLCGHYGFAAYQLLLVFDHLLADPSLTPDDQPALEQALEASITTPPSDRTSQRPRRRNPSSRRMHQLPIRMLRA